MLRNPFPGIRPFRKEEDHLFFGREGSIEELQKRLSNRFLAIVGTSGSGKSSVVRAGLIPRLTKKGWKVVVFRPQNTPLINLFSAIQEKNESKLASDKDSLADLYQEMDLKVPLVIIVDQFEEIFRYHQSESGLRKERAFQFVNKLIAAVEQPEVPIYVVLTLRSEYLGQCAEFRGLPELINDGNFLVPRMTRVELQRAILGFKDLPEYNDVKMSDLLVTRLLDDIEDDSDQLPVLQHALMKTWEAWEQDDDAAEIEIRHYEVTGGMTQAVSLHAESILKELRYQGLEDIARIIFQRITEIDFQSNKIRNPAPLSELIELVGGKREEVERVVKAFRQEGRNFLIPDKLVEIHDSTMIDISHESLIRQWRTLGKWMREEAENAREYRLINNRREQQETEGLLTNPRLAISDFWWLAQKPNVTWASRYHNLDASKYPNQHKKIFKLNEAFLLESKEEQSRIDQANKSEIERQKEARIQRTTFLAVGMMVIVLILAVFLRRNKVLRDDALASADIARQEANESDSMRRIAETARQQAINDRAISDSLREEASLQAVELEQSNTIKDSLAEQARKQRNVAELQSIDAQISALQAQLASTSAKANGAEANILKIISEYQEQIQEAKKQALATLNIEDYQEQKRSALESFEKYDSHNRMLMGGGSIAISPSPQTIEYYVEQLNNLRTELNNTLEEANNWMKESDVSGRYRIIKNQSDCSYQIYTPSDTESLLKTQIVKLHELTTQFEQTCNSLTSVSPERPWIHEYPVENHRALLESYRHTVSPGNVEFDYEQTLQFTEGALKVDFPLNKGKSVASPLVKYIAHDTNGSTVFASNNGMVSVENGSNTGVASRAFSSIRFLDITKDKDIIIGQPDEVIVLDAQNINSEKFKLENSADIVQIDVHKDRIVGLDGSGTIKVWNLSGVFSHTLLTPIDDPITSFDCQEGYNGKNIYLAVGTNSGSVHLLIVNGESAVDSGLKFNKRYSGDEPSLRTVSFSANGLFLVSASSKQIDLWPMSVVNYQNELTPILKTDFSYNGYQIQPIPIGSNRSFQTSKGISSVSFDRSGDYLMFSNNLDVTVTPTNLRIMCQALGSGYCSETYATVSNE